MNFHTNKYISRLSNVIAWTSFILAATQTALTLCILVWFGVPQKLSGILVLFSLYIPSITLSLINYVLVGSMRFKPWVKSKTEVSGN